MTTTPQAPGGAQTADSTTELVGSAAAEAGATTESRLVPTHARGSIRGADGTQRGVRRLRGGHPQVVRVRHRRVPLPGVGRRWIRRRLGVAPMESGSCNAGGVDGCRYQALVALFATALFGQWAGIPWGRWAIILASFAV